MFKIPKLTTIALVLGVVSALIIGSMYISPAFNIEPGAPVPVVSIILTEVDTGESEIISIDPTSGNQLTTITSTLFAVNPNALYSIEFSTRYTVTPPSDLAPGTQLKGFTTMSGKRLPTSYSTATLIFYNTLNPVAGSVVTITTPPTTLLNNTGSAKTVFDRVSYGATGSNVLICGEDLGGSVWTLVCDVQTLYAGNSAYHGTTTLTINMVMGGNNLVVTATGVDVVLTTP